MASSAPPADGDDESLTHTAVVAKELLLTSGIAIAFHGPTMEPFLRDGDRLVVEPVPFDRLRRGDIVTFRSSDKVPTGRIARRFEEQAILTADHWPDFHVTVTRADIVGKVVRRQRSGREISCASWRWRAHTAVALLREAVRARSAVIGRKRAGFVLPQ